MATPGPTVPMISPNGQVGDIPVERVEEASKAGFKQAVDMLSPTGAKGTIPVDQAEKAQKSGFRLANAGLHVTGPESALGSPQIQDLEKGNVEAAKIGADTLAGGEVLRAGKALAAPLLKPVVTKTVTDTGLIDQFGDVIKREAEKIGPSKLEALWSKVAGHATKPGEFLSFPGGQAAERVILADVLNGGNLHKMLMRVVHLGQDEK